MNQELDVSHAITEQNINTPDMNVQPKKQEHFVKNTIIIGCTSLVSLIVGFGIGFLCFGNSTSKVEGNTNQNFAITDVNEVAVKGKGMLSYEFCKFAKESYNPNVDIYFKYDNYDERSNCSDDAQYVTKVEISGSGRLNVYTSFENPGRANSTGALDDTPSSTNTNSPSSSINNSSENKTNDSSFRTFISEYEDFMNRYIDFMKKYNNSSDVTSMLSDYFKIMEEYEEYAKAIDNYSESDLSTEDWLYLIEVTTRINKKISETL